MTCEAGKKKNVILIWLRPRLNIVFIHCVCVCMYEFFISDTVVLRPYMPHGKCLKAVRVFGTRAAAWLALL